MYWVITGLLDAENLTVQRCAALNPSHSLFEAGAFKRASYFSADLLFALWLWGDKICGAILRVENGEWCYQFLSSNPIRKVRSRYGTKI